MEQYIPKSALAAKIERKIKQFVKENNTLLKNSDNAKELRSRIIMCKEILSFLDTLEVKEVDLSREAKHELKAEKELIDKTIEWIGEIYNYHEIIRYSDNHEPSLEELTEWFKNYIKEGVKDE